MPQNVISNTIQVILYKLFFVPDGKRFCHLLESGQESFEQLALFVHNTDTGGLRQVADTELAVGCILLADTQREAQRPEFAQSEPW